MPFLQNYGIAVEISDIFPYRKEEQTDFLSVKTKRAYEKHQKSFISSLFSGRKKSEGSPVNDLFLPLRG